MSANVSDFFFTFGLILTLRSQYMINYDSKQLITAEVCEGLCFYTCLSFCSQGGMHGGGCAWWW